MNSQNVNPKTNIRDYSLLWIFWGFMGFSGFWELAGWAGQEGWAWPFPW